MTGNDRAARVPHGSGRITDNNRAVHAKIYFIDVRCYRSILEI